MVIITRAVHSYVISDKTFHFTRGRTKKFHRSTNPFANLAAAKVLLFSQQKWSGAATLQLFHRNLFKLVSLQTNVEHHYS